MLAKGLAALAGASAVDDTNPVPPRLALTILRALSTSSDAFSKLLGSTSTCGVVGCTRDGGAQAEHLIVLLLLRVVFGYLPVTCTFLGGRDQVI